MTDRIYPYTADEHPANVTVVISDEWADFLTRAQQARNEWRRYRVVDHIAIIDWRNLDLKVVKG